jgi:DNA-binding CsgD family transcriptional regulator
VLRSDIERLAGVIELTCGVPADSSQILFRAATAVAPVDPERALYLLSLASWGAAFARDGETVAAIATRAERLAVPDSPANEFLMLRLLGLRAHFTGDFGGAAPKLRTTLEHADRTDADGLLERFGLAGPVGLFLCDDRAVLALHRRVAARARETGAIALLAQTLPWLALGDLWSGHWAAASAQLSEGLELAQVTGQHQIRAHLLAVQALLSALRGAEARCRALAAAALELASALRLVHVSCCATWALAVLELSLGRPEAALAHAGALPTSAGIEWDALDRIEAAIRAGDPATARRWLDAFEPWAAGSTAPWGRAVVDHGRALLADDAAEAERRFQSALAIHEGAARPFERARTELAFGERLRRAKQRAEAREPLTAALDAFERLGARPWAERARTELRATGGTAGGRRAQAAAEQLTPHELQIAVLVSQGMTNREAAAALFLSPKTIEYHLGQIYRKLDVRGRAQLARLMAMELPEGERDPALLSG